MKRDLAFVSIISLVMTVAGEFLLQSASLYPGARSDKGHEIDHAFHVLLVLAVPVFAIVVSAVIYTALRHRSSGTPPDDGAPLFGRGAVPIAWLGVTTALTLVIMVYPGLTDLAKVTNNPSPDLVVQVQGVQWAWIVAYPQLNVKTLDELVLPVDRTVRFDITSLDVIHSFWVPALRMKQDALPGATTMVTLKPTEIGSYDNDPEMRLQCSQLCGLNHAKMRMPVRVVSGAEFTAWTQAHVPPAAPAPAGAAPAAGTVQLNISARNTRFSTNQLEATAGAPIQLTFANNDAGIVHNFALYAADARAVDGAKTPLAPGPNRNTVTFTISTPGTYSFRCDAHPTEMKGTLVVK